MTASEIIAELRDTLLQDGATESQRVKELQANLAEHGDDALPEIIKLLHDPELRVSNAAADVLQMIGTAKATDESVTDALRHLADPAGQTKLPGPGWQRLRASGNTLLPAMTRAYKPEQPFDIRHALILITHQIADPAGLPLLEAALADRDARLVEAAAEALGSVDGPLAYDRLLAVLESKNPQHRAGAIRGLKLLRNPAAVEPLLGLLLSEDQSATAWSPSSGGAPGSLRQAAAQAIDQLTGVRMNGDVERIRAWLKQNSSQSPGTNS